MSDETQPDPETIHHAEAELLFEHQGLRDVLWRMGAAENAERLVIALDELHPRLKQHFENEESPGGLFERMGAGSERMRARSRDLVEEHVRILTAIENLRSRAGALGSGGVEELRPSVLDLIQWLRRHEQSEHAMAAEAAAASHGTTP